MELEVGRIRELSRGGRHGEALDAAKILSASAPLNRDVWYLIAANQRCLNQIYEALETLRRLQQQQPGFSLLFQECGYCYTTLRAIDAFARAVELNPALTTSWTMLERLYLLTGDAKIQRPRPSVLELRNIYHRTLYAPEASSRMGTSPTPKRSCAHI